MHLVAVVHQDEEEVEAAHDGSRQVDVLLQTLAAIVAAAHRVGGGQDGGAGVKCGLRSAEKGVSQGNRPVVSFPVRYVSLCCRHYANFPTVGLKRSSSPAQITQQQANGRPNQNLAN